MVHPKYSPEEALERVKLMMKYDTSKTLNENKEIILKEDPIVWDAQTIARHIIDASNNAFWDPTDEFRFIEAVKNIKTIDQFNQVNQILSTSGTKKDFVTLVNYEFEESTEDKKYVDEIKTHLEKLGFKVENPVSERKTGTGLSYEVFGKKFKITNPTTANVSSTQPAASANTAANTTKGQETRQQNINNIYCSVDFSTGIIKNEYSQANGKNWNSWVKDQNVTKEEIDTAKKSCPKTGGSSAPTKTTRAVYTYCNGTYKRNCKSETIRKVQACLGMPAKYQTGNFGPITQGELSKKFPQFKDSFTDDDVNNTICSNTNQQPVNNNQTQSNQSFQPGQFDSIAKSKKLTFDQNKFGYLN